MARGRKAKRRADNFVELRGGDCNLCNHSDLCPASHTIITHRMENTTPLELPFLSVLAPASASLSCPNCSAEFSSEDAVIQHLSNEGSCGRWLVHHLSNFETSSAATWGSNYDEDPDAAHDGEFYFYSITVALSPSKWMENGTLSSLLGTMNMRTVPPVGV